MNLELYSSERSCGSCTACCVRLPLAAGTVSPDIKPAGIPCPNLCDAGCQIYALRPTSCSNFRCGWLRFEAWPTAWRPDQSGLLCLWEELDPQTPMAAVYELSPGALESEVGQQIIESLVESSLAVALVGLNEERRLIAGTVSVLSDEHVAGQSTSDATVEVLAR